MVSEDLCGSPVSYSYTTLLGDFIQHPRNERPGTIISYDRTQTFYHAEVHDNYLITTDVQVLDVS